MNESDPQSPCISVCLLDDGDVCVGCYRSADEITDWFVSSPDQKRAILQRAQERQEGASTIKLS